MSKALRVFASILAVLVLVLVAGLYWPMPEVVVPLKADRMLIKSVKIVDVASGKVLKDRNVWIDGNKIVSIDSLSVGDLEPDIFVIEAEDQYLIPGLWDMHTHSTQQSPWLHHPLYVANGVTAIRDMSGQLGREDSYWAGTKDRLKWNDRLESYQQVTPRYVLQSSYQINGANSVPDGFPAFFNAQTAEDAISLLAYYQDEGADFIKVYAEIPVESYRTLAENCSEYGLHLAGHKPLNLSLEEAIVSGQKSFEHARIFMFDCFPNADSLLLAKDKAKAFRKWKPSMITDFDTIAAAHLIELMRRQNSYWTPTLQTVKMSAFADDEAFLQSPHLDYVLTLRKALFWNPDLKRSAKDNAIPETQGINAAFYAAAQQQVAMARRKGVPIMAGTDVTDTYVFPGFSLHAELEDLTKSGLSNLEALQSATLVPAQYSGLENQLGRIGEGKLADLVLLRSNPLADITNTSDIAGVVLNGNYYDQKSLEELKDITKDLASSFHMNVKFIFSLLASPLMRKQIAD